MSQEVTHNLPQESLQWIADLEKPSWDAWFMSLVFLCARRSNDRQTKQGAVIVDWPTKSILGIGYNGHPRKAKGDIPVFRKGSAKYRIVCNDDKTYQRGEKVPDEVMATHYFTKEHGLKPLPALGGRLNFIQGDPDKYVYMCHCETNALISCTGRSDHAVLYIPMPSCEACGGLVLNHPHINVRRIVYYEDRGLRNHIYQTRPDVQIEKFDPAWGHPADCLEEAATYLRLRDRDSIELSANSTRTYR